MVIIMFAALNLKKCLPFFIAAVFLSVLLFFPSACADGITNGIVYSCKILVPSLFPYMVLSSFIMRSGADGMTRGRLTKVVFHLPECCTAAVLLSFVGGFPVGAKCVQLLYQEQKITVAQAQRMLCFCVCSGPAFLITAIGAVMLNNIVVGIILYISQLASCIIIGIAVGIFSRVKKSDKNTETVKNKKVHSEENKGIVSSIIEASLDGANSIIGMTALVLIFSLVVSVLNDSGAVGLLCTVFEKIGVSSRITSTVIPIILEVTGACGNIREAALPVYFYSLAVGFGGLCVHFQIFDIIRHIPIKRSIYLLFRVINAGLSTLITYLICLFYAPDTDVFSVLGGKEADISSVSFAGSIALVVLSVVFVLSFHRKNYQRRACTPDSRRRAAGVNLIPFGRSE